MFRDVLQRTGRKVRLKADTTYYVRRFSQALKVGHSVEQMAFPARHAYRIPLRNGGILDLGSRCLVMGILNVTPDSFAEATPELDPDAVAAAAERMAEDGADMVDIGGESTRPGADPVSVEDELARILPVITRVAGRLRIPISVDTYKAGVARAAIAAGATIVNDISGLRYDHRLAGAAADSGAAIVLMHTRGRPKTMYAEAVYHDLIGEIAAELGDSIRSATEAGVPVDQIMVDPGIGFAKQAAHSYGVLARLPELAAALDRPVVVGPSRKSFMREAAGNRSPAERDWATAGAVAAAVLNGAHIVRVHAVAEMVQVVRVAEEVRKNGRLQMAR